ncbi:hypothetical protein HS088_TW01G00901 [Tripterygium wilfordii]|uniref:Uncharacterized protein n=1 Tax=Tripterygium wilfordii TaxID=458696 RepID=A0A7J7E375_TRIWF|nr:hypothetical protein HS088_TW01G00901 [Tripterygium wilfordii]
MGCLVGGFVLTAFADSSIGRKKLLFLSCLAMSSIEKKNLAPLSLLSKSDRPLDEETSKPNHWSMIKKLFKKKWALKRMVALLVPGFCIGLGYFGMALGVGNLDMNLYLSVTLNALLEIPSSVFTFLMIEKWSRKGSLLTVGILGGVFGLISNNSINKNKRNSDWIGIGRIFLCKYCIQHNHDIHSGIVPNLVEALCHNGSETVLDIWCGLWASTCFLLEER